MTPEQTHLKAGADKRPNIALLGEFSAGKSTLANALLGVQHSLVRVTATQAPPIWYVLGTGHPMQIFLDETEVEVQGGSLDRVALDNTRAVRVPLQAEILNSFSIIDMPGSSDPNMSPDIWDGLLPLADIAIWCTPATQAWRQSEAAIWDMVPEALQQRSLLLLTRMDKVTAPTDRSRIIGRVKRETGGLFRSVLPVSLLQVSQPPARCVASGMSQVMQALAEILRPSPAKVDATARPAPARSTRETREHPTVMPRRVTVQASNDGLRIIRRPRSQDPAP